MVDREVLTQDEIDALLTGVDEGGVDLGDGVDDLDVSPWDLTSQDRVVLGRLPTVELVAERFARHLRHELPTSLKFPFDIGQGGVQIMKYSEYIEMLGVPTCIKMLRIPPFFGTCLLTITDSVVHCLVDRFFGGSGDVSELEGKDFTPTELRVIERVTDVILNNFRVAWEDVLPIECEVLATEVNPGLVNVMAQNDAVMICSFRVDIEELSGEVHMVFPYAALEPYKSILDSKKPTHEDSAVEYRAGMEAAIMDAEMPLSCVIGTTVLRLRDLLQLAPGDVLDLNVDEQHEVRVASVPKFVANLGDSRGRFALEFETFI
ncbi:MAG: flagellar motor switch protein FliM [Pseudomonadota bacterium]